MKLLLDANLSPRLVPVLASAGYEAAHVDGEGLLGASDAAIFDHARERGLVVVTADSDFPMLLALRRTSNPSVIHLRDVAELTPDVHGALLIANLPAIQDALQRGAIVSMNPTRVAIRDLPIR